ncbi:hypothetical protein BLOT_010182 [Blomia tropicalis]|nr:hypothetical protein BLOT_010182 [Blomia tropicalis]
MIKDVFLNLALIVIGVCLIIVVKKTNLFTRKSCSNLKNVQSRLFAVTKNVQCEWNIVWSA